jgi:hypothetical protein
MKSESENTNQRVFYWVIMSIILVMFGLMYEQYIDLEDALHRTNKVSSRQAQLTVQSWNDKVQTRNRKIELLEQHILFAEEHHMKEVSACVAYYTEALEEAKKR